MSFLNPLFLFGLLAAAIPIIIHLFTRRRPREMRFPSLEFLAEVNQSEIRRLKLKQWLLLLLRTLAVASLALAMSRPAFKGGAGLKSGAGTSVVVLVDQSGSMSAGSRAGSLMAEARRAIEDLLSTLGPADELLLVPYDQGPHPATAKPSSDLLRLRAAVQALEAGARTTDHEQGLAFAGRALGQSHALNRELFWLSDFQAGGFASSPGGAMEATAPGAPAALRLPPGPWSRVRAYLVPLAADARGNVALSDAALAPSETGAALSVAALGFGAEPGDLAVEVHDMSDHSDLGRGFLSLPGHGEASTLLPLARLPAEGGEATIPDDALALDNRRVFAAGRAGTMHVLLREDGPPSALRMALEAGSPSSGIMVEAVDAARLPGRAAEADAIVLDDLAALAPAEQQAVLDFYRSGGALFVVLGNRAGAAFWNPILAELGAGALGPTQQAPAGAAWRLKRAVAGHPVLAGFSARPGEPLSAARFPSVRAFEARPGARVLLEFDRAHPALIEIPHGMVFVGPLDAPSSDFPVSGAYLPLLHQIVKVLGRGTAAASLVPGDRFSAPATTGTWRIENEQHREVPSELIAAAGATRLRSAPLEKPGLYRVLEGGRVRSTFAVNPDPREGDLTPLPEPALVRAFPAGRAQVVHAGGDLARRVREARYGRELWSWFVILALLFLVAETVIARWGMTSRAPAAA